MAKRMIEVQTPAVTLMILPELDVTKIEKLSIEHD